MLKEHDLIIENNMNKKGSGEGSEKIKNEDYSFGKKVERKLEEKELTADDFNKGVEDGRILNTKLIALFVIGVLIGITLKTHAVRTITMGFEDYKLAQYADDFNFKEPEEDPEEVQEEEIIDEVAEEMIENEDEVILDEQVEE